MSKLLWIMGAVVLMVGTTARADWNVGDDYKMHYPQLPDPNGWAVSFNQTAATYVLADDWVCTASGDVDDLHFWIGWHNNITGIIFNITATIYSDVPVTQSVTGYSHPGSVLWSNTFTAQQFTLRDYGTGVQSWYDPLIGQVVPNDHTLYQQINIDNISALVQPFVQTQGTVYWLGLDISYGDGFVGWKTSGSQQYLDSAVYYSDAAGWLKITGEQVVDLSFVITPEPTSIALLAVGCLPLLRRRHA